MESHKFIRNYTSGGYLRDDLIITDETLSFSDKPPNPLKSDLINNLSKVRAYIETKTEEVLNKIEEITTVMENAISIARDRSEKAIKAYEDQQKKLKASIINLLKEKAVKMPASDIDAFLKHQNVDEIKEFCENMYHNGEISRTANYRYFILSEEKKEPKKASAAKSESTDIPEQIKKLSDLKDQGIITEEEFQNKKKDLLDRM